MAGDALPSIHAAGTHTVAARATPQGCPHTMERIEHEGPRMPTLAPLLRASSLKKSYGAHAAVLDVSFEVAAGEVLGLLGPNGAGKSTTIAMVCGLTPPDGGNVLVGGTAMAQDEAACKRRIGLVPQDLALFEDLPAQSNVELFGALYGLPPALARRRAAEVLAAVGLADRARDKPATYSGGMKRRLNIACALVHDPDVLLLDEPTAGVDPQSRNAIFDTLLALKAAGKALVYTTHYMEEVERLADRVVIIDHGRVVAQGTLPELYRTLPMAQKLTLDIEGEPTSAWLQALPGVRTVTQANGRWILGLDDLAHDTVGVLQALGGAGLAVRHIASDRANLEDVFLALTGRQLRD
jgi:ABC-2 type transport system ATP-binding protein